MSVALLTGLNFIRGRHHLEFIPAASGLVNARERGKPRKQHTPVSKNSSSGGSRGMGGKCGGNSSGAAANTNHCKSPADSREPRRARCAYVTIRRLPRNPPPRSSVEQPTFLPSHVSQPFTSPLKIKNSGVLAAPLLQLFNSGSVAITTEAVTTSNKVTLKKTLSIYVATATADP